MCISSHLIRFFSNYVHFVELFDVYLLTFFTSTRAQKNETRIELNLLQCMTGEMSWFVASLRLYFGTKWTLQTSTDLCHLSISVSFFQIFSATPSVFLIWICQLLFGIWIFHVHLPVFHLTENKVFSLLHVAMDRLGAIFSRCWTWRNLSQRLGLWMCRQADHNVSIAQHRCYAADEAFDFISTILKRFISTVS